MEITRARKELEILENDILKQLRTFEFNTKLIISDFTISKNDTITMGGEICHDYLRIISVKIKVEI